MSRFLDKPFDKDTDPVQDVVLTGRKLKVGQYKDKVNTEVAADATATLTIVPTAGYIGRLKAVSFYCPAVAGGTGNHYLDIQVGVLDKTVSINDLAAASAAGAAALALGNGIAEVALYKDAPFSVDKPLLIAYTAPLTNPQTGFRYYHVLWEEEAIV